MKNANPKIWPWLAAALWLLVPQVLAAAAPDFAREVRPILERSCFGCHGPDKQKSGYRLDIREVAIKGGDSGKPAIVPHDSKGSHLIRLVSSDDDETVMPPRSSKGSRPTLAEVDLLRAWIDAGPAWPEELAGPKSDPNLHWSLKPLVRPTLPTGVGHPIDSFILARLKEKSIEPSPEASRRTLIRRVYFDLIGLPPSPAEVDAFERDTDPAAYEKLVDRLMASPRYGERWARHWFDTIHFADSHGYEHDIGRPNAWRFRDYVIGAFNRDTLWAQFIREQLAADRFCPNEPQLTPALGFLGAGTFDLSTFTTGPVTFSYLDRDDLVTQTMSAFVSTTANCARCHAHKFDPIPQEDYYALQAVFAGILKGDLEYDEQPGIAYERRRWKSLLAAIGEKDPAVLLAPEHAPKVAQWSRLHSQRAVWQPLAGPSYRSEAGSTFTQTTGGIVFVGGPRPDKDTYIVTATAGRETIAAIRLNVFADDTLPMHGPGRQDNGNFHLSEFELRILESGSAEPKKLKIRRATADFNQADWGIARAIDGDDKTAWGIHPSEGQSHYAVFELAEPVRPKPGDKLELLLRQLHGNGHVIGAFNLALTGDATDAEALSITVESALSTAPAERTELQRLELATVALRSMAQEAIALLPAPNRVYAAAPAVDILTGDPPRQAQNLKVPKPVNVLYRGDFDKPRAVALPGALSALSLLPARFELSHPDDEGERRVALANWIASPANVLTWRSIVNRVWQYHFGRGICDTPSDLGKMGGTPSHPELIDWLAVWFRDDAHGSLKELHRLIVTSAAYRRSSQHRDGPTKLDSDNRLLWRQNRMRLDADGYRDFAQSASGTLDLTMGGPAIQHFIQSKGPQLTPALDYAGYDWTRPEAGRRSIYRCVWRGIPDPFMDALDFPDLGLLSPTRGFSASSLQALTLYNNNFVLRQSLALAERVTREAKSPGEQVRRAIQLLWLRQPTAEERHRFESFVQIQGLPALCRILLNSNEFLFVE